MGMATPSGHPIRDTTGAEAGELAASAAFGLR